MGNILQIELSISYDTVPAWYITLINQRQIGRAVHDFATLLSEMS